MAVNVLTSGTPVIAVVRVFPAHRSLTIVSLDVFVRRTSLSFILVPFSSFFGRTRSSELGVLSTTRPRLVIKPWKAVPPVSIHALHHTATERVAVASGLFCYVR